MSPSDLSALLRALADVLDAAPSVQDATAHLSRLARSIKRDQRGGPDPQADLGSNHEGGTPSGEDAGALADELKGLSVEEVLLRFETETKRYSKTMLAAIAHRLGLNIESKTTRATLAHQIQKHLERRQTDAIIRSRRDQ